MFDECGTLVSDEQKHDMCNSRALAWDPRPLVLDEVRLQFLKARTFRCR